MEHVYSDTDPDTERVHLKLLRGASPGRRLGLALSLSRTVMGLARNGLERGLAGRAPDEAALRFVALYYGSALAADVRAHLATRRP